MTSSIIAQSPERTTGCSHRPKQSWRIAWRALSSKLVVAVAEGARPCSVASSSSSIVETPAACHARVAEKPMPGMREMGRWGGSSVSRLAAVGSSTVCWFGCQGFSPPGEGRVDGGVGEGGRSS